MSKFLKILLIEDDAYFRADIANKLRAYGEIQQCDSRETALAAIQAEKYDVAFIDLNLQGRDDGLEIIQASLRKGISPIVLTSYEDRQRIAKAYEMGCKHYFSKVDFQKDVDRQVGYYLKSLRQEDLASWIAKEYVTCDTKLIRDIEQLRGQNLNRDQRILILGPTGVGKTKLAKIIHQLSEPSLNNFVHLNIAEFPDTLAESMLFGYKKGAFTGADCDRNGFLEKANGGTLFLDEIGSISQSLQKKLLKVLEEKEFTPLGSTQSQKSDFRLITATCEDMPKLIESKRFRIDFYFRIKGIEVSIPALRERRGDIDLLVQYFISRSARRVTFTEAARDTLRAYDWHGNVRELESIVHQYTNGSLGLVNLGDLPPHVQRNQNPMRLQEEHKVYTRNASTFIQKHGLRAYMRVVEQEAFREYFARFDGNLSKTQEALGISKSAAYRIYESIKIAGGLHAAN